METIVQVREREQVCLGGSLLLRRGHNRVPTERWSEMKRSRRTQALVRVGVLAEVESKDTGAKPEKKRKRK